MNVRAIAMGVGCAATLAVAGPCAKNPEPKSANELATLGASSSKHKDSGSGVGKPFSLPFTQPPNTFDDMRISPGLRDALLGHSRLPNSTLAGPQDSGAGLGKLMISPSSALAPNRLSDPKNGINWLEALRESGGSLNITAIRPKNSGSGFGKAIPDLLRDPYFPSLGLSNSGGLLAKTVPVLPHGPSFPLNVPWDNGTFRQGLGPSLLPKNTFPLEGKNTVSADPLWLPPGLRSAVNKWDSPFRAVGNRSIDVVVGVVRFAQYVWPILLGFVGFAFCLALAAVVIRLLFAAVAKNPALYRSVLSAGLGASFGLLLSEAFKAWSEEKPHEAVADLVAIVVVSLGAVVFIEPLQEWFGHRLGLHKEESTPRSAHAEGWYRAAAFGIFACASLSHGLLHKKIDEDLQTALRELACAFLIPGAITYAWIYGARLAKSRAAMFGALAGAAAGGAAWLAYILLAEKAANLPVTAKVASFAVNSVVWGAAGYFGGLAIDRQWFSRWIATSPGRASIPVVLVVLIGGLLALPAGAEPWDVIGDLGRTLGWAGGLVAVSYAADGVWKVPDGSAPPASQPSIAMD